MTLQTFTPLQTVNTHKFLHTKSAGRQYEIACA